MVEDVQTDAAKASGTMTWEQLCQDLEQTQDRHHPQQPCLDALRIALNQDAAAGHLPSYELRKRQQQLKTLEDRVAASRPRSKAPFAFAGRTTRPQPVSAPQPTSAADAGAPSSSSSTGAVPVRGQHLDAARLQLIGRAGQAASISDCADCVLDWTTAAGDGEEEERPWALGSVHVQRLQRCLVLLPPISANLLVYDCKDCQFFGSSAQQLRVHSSSNLALFLDASTPPVLEDCQDIGIGSTSTSLLTQLPPPPPPQPGSQARDFNDPADKAGLKSWSAIPSVPRPALERDAAGQVDVAATLTSARAQMSRIMGATSER